MSELSALADGHNSATPQGVFARRLAAGIIDLSALRTFTDVITNQIASPMPPVVLELLETCIAFGWWSSSAWLGRGQTLGMVFTGLVVRDPRGERASIARHAARGLFLACFISPGNLYGLLNGLLLGHLPAALEYVQFGAGIGYLSFLAMGSRAGWGAVLPHDRWTGTRVIRAVALPGPGAAEPAPAGGGVMRALIAAGALIGLAFGCMGQRGFDVRALWTPKPRASRIERLLEGRLAHRYGIRSTVSVTHRISWGSTHPRRDVLAIDTRLPWAAFGTIAPESLRVALMDSLRIDSHTYQRVELKVGSKTQGLLLLQLRYGWAWEFDSTRSVWRLTSDDKH